MKNTLSDKYNIFTVGVGPPCKTYSYKPLGLHNHQCGSLNTGPSKGRKIPSVDDRQRFRLRELWRYPLPPADIYVITMPRGEKNKLTDEDILAIHDLKGKKSGYKVAEQYKISHTMVYKIWGRQPPKTYKMALHQIHTELEKTRGVEMNQPVFDMWCNIKSILDTALEKE